MKKRSTAWFAAIVTTAALLTGCGGKDKAVGSVDEDCKPAHEFSTIKEGTLTVVSYDLPPYSMVKGPELTGVDGDILKYIAEKECLTITLMPVATAAVVPTVQSKRADLAAGDWYRTAERAEIVTLSDPLYLDQMGLISEDGVTAIPDLKGQRVGTVDGYLWVADLKAYLGDDVKIYAAGLNMYEDLKAGRLDVAVDSFGSGAFTVKDEFKVEVAEPQEEVAASLEGAQSTFPMTKDNDEMLAALNEIIAEMHENGKMAEILEANGLDASAADTGEPRLIS